MQALFLFGISKADASHEGVGRETEDSENIFEVNISLLKTQTKRPKLYCISNSNILEFLIRDISQEMYNY